MCVRALLWSVQAADVVSAHNSKTVTPQGEARWFSGWQSVIIVVADRRSDEASQHWTDGSALSAAAGLDSLNVKSSRGPQSTYVTRGHIRSASTLSISRGDRGKKLTEAMPLRAFDSGKCFVTAR